jgi:hypothetical protein
VRDLNALALAHASASALTALPASPRRRVRSAAWSRGWPPPRRARAPKLRPCGRAGYLAATHASARLCCGAACAPRRDPGVFEHRNLAALTTCGEPSWEPTSPDVRRHKAMSSKGRAGERRTERRPASSGDGPGLYGMQEVRGSNPLSSTLFRILVRVKKRLSSDNGAGFPLMLTIMKVAGSSPCDAEGASGQLNKVKPPGGRQVRCDRNPHRMRSTQEISPHLAPFSAIIRDDGCCGVEGRLRRSRLLVEELCGGGRVHDVRPDLFFGSHRAFRHCVIRHPCVGLTTGYEAKDGRDESSRD